MMDTENSGAKNGSPSEMLETLIALCDDLAFGRNADADKLYAQTRSGSGPEPLVRLAEAFGMMLVKVEAREYGNVRLIEELKERNTELESARSYLSERNAHLVSVAADRSRNVIGNCPTMLQVVDLAMSIARRPINTLITGPTGSGKEVVAKLIHFNSPRREGPFMAVNCTAIPDSLFESEMFGIEKGVATGVDKRKGLMEAANGGTLFLDEIGDMSPANQVKLLRALEEREIMRVGAVKPIPVDIKIICATNAMLAEAVKNGKFREDLYYRLNVAEIRLPALKDRGDDILLLAQHFLNKHCEQLGRPRLSFSPEARQCLLAHSWPGNVRELNNEMERAAALTPGKRIERDDLSPRLSLELSSLPEAGLPELTRPGASIPRSSARGNDTPQTSEADFNLHGAEKELIRRALDHAGGNRANAARLLGITREGLRKKLLRMERGIETVEAD